MRISRIAVISMTAATTGGTAWALPTTLTTSSTTADIYTASNAQGEQVASVMPPFINSSCSSGKTLITYGAWWAESMFTGSSASCTTSSCISSTAPPALVEDIAGEVITTLVQSTDPVSGTCNHTMSPTTIQPFDQGTIGGRPYGYVYTDSQVARTSQAYTGYPAHNKGFIHVGLQDCAHAPTSPVADIYQASACTMGTDCSSGVCTMGVCQPSCNQPFRTQCLYVETSDDCAATWTQKFVADINNNWDGGAYAVPQTQGYNVGYGFDRHELYVDPFSNAGGRSDVYISSSVAGKASPITSNTVFSSNDGGATWPSTNVIILPSNGEPVTMTSTPANASLGANTGHLFMAYCNAGNALLYWKDRASTTLQGPVTLMSGCGVVPPTNLYNSARNQDAAIAISRIQPVSTSFAGNCGHDFYDGVRLLVPTIDHDDNTQVYDGFEVCVLKTGAPGGYPATQVVNWGLTLYGPTNVSVLQARFTETDRFEYAPPVTDVNQDAAILQYYTWANTVNTVHTSQQMYKLVQGDWNWSSAHNLSLSGGAAASWTPNLVNNFMGDYTKGAFYYIPASGDVTPAYLEYRNLWVQSDTGMTATSRIAANTVYFAN